jgi:hypothetical protein
MKEQQDQAAVFIFDPFAPVDAEVIPDAYAQWRDVVTGSCSTVRLHHMIRDSIPDRVAACIPEHSMILDVVVDPTLSSYSVRYQEYNEVDGERQPETGVFVTEEQPMELVAEIFSILQALLIRAPECLPQRFLNEEQWDPSLEGTVDDPRLLGRSVTKEERLEAMGRIMDGEKMVDTNAIPYHPPGKIADSSKDNLTNALQITTNGQVFEYMVRHKPRSGHNKCHGRGFIGWDATKKCPRLCSCIKAARLVSSTTPPPPPSATLRKGDPRNAREI